MTETSRPSLLSSAYPLLLSGMAGGVLMDQVYFRTIRATVPADLWRSLSSNASDALLLLALPVLIAGGVSVLVSAGRARQMFVASIGVFSLEFLVPALAGALPDGATYLTITGPFLRMLVLLGALALAFMATRQVAR